MSNVAQQKMELMMSWMTVELVGPYDTAAPSLTKLKLITTGGLGLNILVAKRKKGPSHTTEIDQ